MKTLLVSLALLALPTAAAPGAATQEKWALRDGFFQSDGKAVFLHGANYVVSKNWLLNLARWDEAAVAADMQAMRGLGVNCVRYFPLWHLVQPGPDRLDETILQRLDRLIELAGQNGIGVQLAPLTGFVSGPVFLPPWARGNIFTDPAQIQAQQFLVRELARRYRDNPHVQGFDFGNEINVLLRNKLKLEATEAQIDAWMRAIYAAFKAGAPDKAVTNGIGTGYPSVWRVENMRHSVDYLSIHYYPEFSGAVRQDPYIGLRATYGVNCAVAWAEMGGKPVLIQEIGVPSGPMPEDEIAKFLRLTCLSSWADGAIGYLWWCSHNIAEDFRIDDTMLDPAYNRTNRLTATESVMGLLDEHNRPRGYAAAFAECGRLVDQLGVGWKNTQPVCYIVAQQDAEQKSTFPFYLNPYALAKQVHLDVKFLHEADPVPADAAAVVVPGFALTAAGKRNLAGYLARGGTVYQSFHNDFADGLKPGAEELTRASPTLVVDTVDGNTFLGQRVRLAGSMKLRPVQAAPGVTTIMYLLKSDAVQKDRGDHEGGVLFRATVGAGTYYYLAADLERALATAYEPWAACDAEVIYSMLRPKSGLSLDNKHVELFHLQRGQETLLVLLNHTDRFQDAILRTAQPLGLRDAETGETRAPARKFTFRLEPAQVLIQRIDATAN